MEGLEQYVWRDSDFSKFPIFEHKKLDDNIEGQGVLKDLLCSFLECQDIVYEIEDEDEETILYISNNGSYLEFFGNGKLNFIFKDNIIKYHMKSHTEYNHVSTKSFKKGFSEVNTDGEETAILDIGEGGTRLYSLNRSAISVPNAYLWTNGQQLFNTTYYEATSTPVSATQSTIGDRYNWNPHTSMYQSTLPMIGYYGINGYLYKFLSYPYSGISGAASGHYTFKDAQSYGADITGKDFEYWAIKPAPKFQYIGTGYISSWVDSYHFILNGHNYYLKPGQQVVQLRRIGNLDGQPYIEEYTAYGRKGGGPGYRNTDEYHLINGFYYDKEHGTPGIQLCGHGTDTWDAKLPFLDWRYRIKINPYLEQRIVSYSSQSPSWTTSISSQFSSLYRKISVTKTYEYTYSWDREDEWRSIRWGDSSRTTRYRYTKNGGEAEDGYLKIKMHVTGDIPIFSQESSNSFINNLLTWTGFSTSINGTYTQAYPRIIGQMLLTYHTQEGVFPSNFLEGMYLIGDNIDTTFGAEYVTTGTVSLGYRSVDYKFYYTNACYGEDNYFDARVYSNGSTLDSITSPYTYIYDPNGVDEQN